MAKYYIDLVGGSNSDNGQYATPWNTIGYALDSCANNDELIVKAGIYTLAGSQYGGTAWQKTGIVIRGETSNPEDTVINASGYNISITSQVGSTFEFSNFTIKNTNVLINSANGCSYNFKNVRLDTVSNVLYTYGVNDVSISFLMCEFVAGEPIIQWAISGARLSATFKKCLFATRTSAPSSYGIVYHQPSTTASNAINFNSCIFVNKTADAFAICKPTSSGCPVTLDHCTLYNTSTGSITKPSSPYTLTEIATLTTDPLFIDIDSEIWDLQTDSPAAYTGTI